MSNLLSSKALEFSKDNSNLVIKKIARAFSLSEINLTKSILKHLVKNHISALYLDISHAVEVDSNVESMLYQIAIYFEGDEQKRLTLKANDNSEIQRNLVANFIKICPSIDIEFLIKGK